MTTLSSGQTIRLAVAEQVRLSARAAARLIQEMRSPSNHEALTHREREVLRGMATCRTSREIAQSLGSAVTTVKTHVRSILDQLGASSRTQAALHAVRSRMFSQGELMELEPT